MIRIDTTVHLDLHTVIDLDLEWFLDKISELATGTVIMQDIAWDLKGATDTGDLVLHVTGFVDTHDLSSEEQEELLEHIKAQNA